MAVRKEPSGRFRAVVKSGRQYVTGKTFDTKREAVAWEQRERAALAGGVDPSASRQTLRTLLPMWLDERKCTVATTTAHADSAMVARLPTPLLARSVGSVTERDVQRVLIGWSGRYAEGSVTRWRASLASFFAWCVREHIVTANPVTATNVPRKDAEPTGMRPLTEPELDDVVAAVRHYDEWAANIVLIAAWTGLRWSELRAVTVADFSHEPMALLRVRQAAPEAAEIKTTKGRTSRVVPIAARVLPLVEEFASGKDANGWLFTTATGGRLHASNFRRTARWSQTGEGRRLHDLRHTAICLWLARGVDVPTARAWAGHASIATTNRYVTHLGTGADLVGLERLNAPGHIGGTDEHIGKEDGLGNDEAPGR